MIAWPDGRADRTTEVYWLQCGSRYADLRIPRGRPEFGRASCLRDMDWPMLRFMARQEGFIGHLEVSNSIAHWHRAFDYQPETGVADRGSLHFEDGILVEQGLETAYVEHWRRDDDAKQGALAIWLATDASDAIGCLIAAGTAFIYAQGRAKRLPSNTSLSLLLDSAASLEEAQQLFDCEISFGRRSPDGWRIEMSLLPFREGQMLRPELADNLQKLSVDGLTADGNTARLLWRIVDWEITTHTSLQASPFDWIGTASVENITAPPTELSSSRKIWKDEE
jgi:hypothetical protein